MSTDANRKTAIAMIEKMSQGVIGETLLAPDVSWWVPGRGAVSKQDFISLAGAFHSICKTPVTMTITGITAENDRVAVEANAQATLINNKHYRNTYHFLFQFEKGKIKLAKEYNDTQHVTDTIGDLLTNKT